MMSRQFMIGRGLVWAGLLVALVVAGSAYAQDAPLPIDPFADMTDLERLTSPMVGSTGQTSSYDRGGGNGDAIFWYYLRGEPKRVVMADLAGPGCVSRIWVTAFHESTARIEIFVDNANTPTVSAYMRDFFGSGSLPPFVPPLSMPSTGSWVCNVPIVYQKSCRIEAIDARTDSNVIYYNVSYRTYPPGESVGEVFQMPPTTAQQAKIDQFTSQWNNRGQDPKGTAPGQQTVSGSPYIAPNGGSAVLANLSGAGRITGITVNIQPDNWDNKQWARLRIRWDGSGSYAVDSPIGAFFGCGFPPANAEGLPIGTINGQMYCYFPMPYVNGAVIEILNSSSTVISSASYTITYVPQSAGEIGRYRFHADARSQTPTGGGQPSYRILDSTGKGHYLGCVLSIESLAGSWGVLEGDEEIYVDGETYPSIHGTGTEDYFNGGFYYSNGPVSWPFSGCSVIRQSWPLLNSAYRLSIMDAVVFNDGIIVDMEHGGQNEASGNYYSTAWFYRDDAAGDPPTVPSNSPLPAGNAVNGDFENGFGGYNNGEANGWVAYQPRDLYDRDLNTFSAATDQKFSGSTSQKILLKTPVKENLSTGIAQQVPVSRGTAYQVTARFRFDLGPGLSEGDLVARLGVGTSGTTYYENPGIVWTNAPTTPDTWHTVTALVTAETDFLTIFADGRRTYTWPIADATLWIDAVTLQPYTGAPLPPTNLTVAAGNQQVALSWDASLGAVSYSVKRSTTSGGPYPNVATGVTTTSYTDTSLTNGTTYYYVVTSVNGNGESGGSNEASATPNDVAFADDFDDNDISDWTVWYASWSVGYGASTTMDGPGDYSLHLSINGNPGASFGVYRHVTGLIPGHRYQIDGQWKGNDDSYEWYEVMLVDYAWTFGVDPIDEVDKACDGGTGRCLENFMYAYDGGKDCDDDGSNEYPGCEIPGPFDWTWFHDENNTCVDEGWPTWDDGVRTASSSAMTIVLKAGTYVGVQNGGLADLWFDDMTLTDLDAVTCQKPVLTTAVSRKTHDTAGDWDINVGTGVIESRSNQLGTANPNALLIVATFDINVALLGSSDVTTEVGTVSSVVPGSSANELEITITDLAFNTQVNLAFPGVVDARCPSDPACASDSTLCVRVIVGDYDGLGRTNFLDFSKVKTVGHLNQWVNSVDKARADFDCGSRPNFLDFSKVKNAGLLNQTAPACPTPPITP